MKVLEKLLSQNEGKTLEFKENTNNLKGIIKSIIAFANTAGGVILVGVRNNSKEIIGLENSLIILNGSCTCTERLRDLSCKF